MKRIRNTSENLAMDGQENKKLRETICLALALCSRGIRNCIELNLLVWNIEFLFIPRLLIKKINMT